MIRYRRFWIDFLIFVLWAAMAFSAPRASHVFVVSVDGGKPEVMQQSAMSTLNSMVTEGAVTWRAQSVYPSITLVAHTSMLTGIAPLKHKVDWNDWLPEKGYVLVPTVFSLAKMRHYTTAMFVGKEKFHHLDLPGSLDVFSYPGLKARTVSNAAAEYTVFQKTNLCFIHFSDADGTGHEFGWGSPEQRMAFSDVDSALGTLRQGIERAGLADDSVVIITADHGGHDCTHGSDSPEDMTIPWIAWGKGVKRGIAITQPVTLYDTAATALWLLDVPIPEDWDGRPVLSAFAYQH